MISILLTLNDSLNAREQISVGDVEQLLFIDTLLVIVIILLSLYMIALIYFDLNQLKSAFITRVKTLLKKLFGRNNNVEKS